MEKGWEFFNTLFSFYDLPPPQFLSLCFLVFMRLGPIIVLSPFLGAKLPSPVKVGLLLVLTSFFIPSISQHVTNLPALSFSTSFSFLCIKELFLGICLAILVLLPFQIVQASGVIIDFMRGSTSLMVADPIMQNQISPLGVLYNSIFIVLFYQIDGPFLFFQSFLHSYQLLPVDTLLSAHVFQTSLGIWPSFMQLLTRFTLLSIQLAAPSIVAILMAEMFLGIANRLAPQVQIAFLGMALKSLLGIFLLWAGWFFILKQIAKQALLWIASIDRLLPFLQ